MDNEDTAISTHDLAKRYRDRWAVDHITITVPRGSVTGFVGRNGAGKTTTMRMLLGLIRPSAGTATVLGAPITRPDAYLARVGALIETPSFHPGLTAIENLRVLARAGGLPERRIEPVLAFVGLTDRGHDRVRSYSLGMRQRLGLAVALLPDPELLILDEPANGLDPPAMAELRTQLGRIADHGVTVLISSHLLGEIHHLCDRLVVIDDGRVRYAGPLDGLEPAGQLVVAPEHPEDRDRLAAVLRAHELPATTGTGTGTDDTVVVTATPEHAAAVNRAAAFAGITLRLLTTHQASLEQQVLALTTTGAPA